MESEKSISISKNLNSFIVDFELPFSVEYATIKGKVVEKGTKT